MLHAEQRAGDVALAFRRLHDDPQQRVIVGLALVPDLGDADVAFAREVRRVHHVHRVRDRPHQAHEHGGGDRLDVELGRGAFDLDADMLDRALGELAGE